MKNRILPRTISNEFKGHKAALWAFYVYTLYTLFRGVMHAFLPDGGAQSIATIPLDTYSVEAVRVIVSIFAQWGLSQLLFALANLIVAIKYKALIPVMYILGIIDMVGRIIIIQLKPFEVAEAAPGGIGSYIILPILIALFLLSVYEKR